MTEPLLKAAWRLKDSLEDRLYRLSVEHTWAFVAIVTAVVGTIGYLFGSLLIWWLL